mmetsp:Transcript_61920/g.98106  ORF Transcript_61920/g.98106 Transcript_61920/m.98106 type:complete len:709 (-) Transcript_61920:111-2237(-)
MNVASEIRDLKAALEKLEARVTDESEERKREGATMLQAIEAIIKTVNQESEDHMRQFQETRKMFTDAKDGINAISNEVKNQKAGTDEFLVAVNSMKQALDLEQCEHVNKHKEFASWVADAKASVEDVKAECEKQQSTNDELMRLLNALKSVVDKEAQERIDNGNRLEKHIDNTEGIRTSVLSQIDSQRNSTDELLRVVNVLKEAFDREQHDGIVKQSEILKCIEDTHSAVTESLPAAGNKDIAERLRRLRIETNNSLANPDLSSHLAKPPNPLPAISSSGQLAEAPAPHQPAQVGTPPIAIQGAIVDTDALKDAVLKEVAQSSMNKEALREAVLQEVAQATKKTAEAMEQERKEREDRYHLLDTKLANFQYDFAVERNERTQLHGELISIKGELNRKVDLVSQDMRAIQVGEKQALPKPLVAQVDSSTMGEAVKLEVARVFGEFSANHKDLVNQEALLPVVKLEVARVFGELSANQRDLLNQEKSLRATDVLNIETRIAELTKDFTKQIESILANMSTFPGTGAGFISRAEFEDQYRQILEEAVGQDSSGIPREEFEDHLQRIWEAIMQLQAKQLEELREKTREAAFNNGLAGGVIGSPRKLLNSTKAIANMHSSSNSTPSNVMPKSDRASPQSRHSGSSPFRNTLTRGAVSSGQPSPPSGGGTNIFTAPTTLLNENLIPTPVTISDAVTPRTSVGARTPGVPLYRNQ